MACEKLQACSAIRNLVRTGFTVPVLLPALLIGATVWLVGNLEDEAPVSAFAVLLPDADGDGTRDEFEKSMFTDMDEWDTDGDTWSDSEEFAMRTNPNNGGRYPVAIPRLSTNLVARGDGNRLHVLCAAYFMDASNQSGAQFSLGLLMGRRYRSFSSNYLAINGEAHSVAARPMGSKVSFFEISFADTLLAPGDRATFLAMLTLPGETKPRSVSRLDVTKDANGVLIMEYPTSMAPNGPVTGRPLPSGNIYLPIPTSNTGPGAVPLTWVPTELCLKKTQTVGRIGALITQEVTEARCVVGLEGFCYPTVCANTIGEQFQTVDPLVLAGSQ